VFDSIARSLDTVLVDVVVMTKPVSCPDTVAAITVMIVLVTMVCRCAVLWYSSPVPF